MNTEARRGRESPGESDAENQGSVLDGLDEALIDPSYLEEAERRIVLDEGGRGSDGDREYGEAIRALPSALEWSRDETSLFRRANAIHVAFVRSQLESLGEAGGAIRAGLSEMPMGRRLRVELAPEVYRLLHFVTDETADEVCRKLKSYCALEKRIEAGSAPNGKRGVSWSALGDVRVLGEGPGDEAEEPASRRRAGGLAFAPVRRGAVIDGHSPHHARIFEERPWPVERHRAAEFDEAVSKISSAQELVRAVCEPACGATDACLRVVALAATPERPDMTLSSSIPELIGTAGLTNLHSKVWAVELVAEALVHEAIHSLIFKVELAESLFSSYAAARTMSVDSPWSGRRLPLGGFVHACFVWYGLWRFWRRADSSHTVHGASLAKRARKGFESGAVLRHMPPEGASLLTPCALEAIEAMSEKANADSE